MKQKNKKTNKLKSFNNQTFNFNEWSNMSNYSVKLLFVVIYILFIGCGQETYVIATETGVNPNRKTISFDDLKNALNEPTFSTRISIEKQIITNKNSKESFSLADFEIDTKIINSLTLNKTVYSMILKPLFKENSFGIYNLILFNDNGKINRKIVKFVPDKEWIYDVQSTKNNPFKGTIYKIYDSDDKHNVVNRSASQLPFCYNTIESWACDCAGHRLGDPTCTCSAFSRTYDVEITYCPTSGGGGNTNPTQSYPTGGGGNINPYDTTFTPVLPVFDDVDARNNYRASYFYSYLESETQNWVENNSYQFSQIIQHLINNNWSVESNLFANEIINQIIQNPGFNFDIDGSFKSPMNIDKSSITDATDEGKEFNELYNALKKSPEFKKLFLDIFQDGNRFNVKFEIDDHVYEDNNPAKKEVRATTSQDPVSNNIVIKISKQILSPDGTMKQTKIENAKTILHECIHAYLFVKSNDPTAKTDFVKILNTMYPTPAEQHDFMYTHMIPTMQKVLTEIRDLVTTAPKRLILEAYTMHPTTNPMTSTPFNWVDFYKFLSYSGLEEASCFKEYVLKDPNLLSLFNQYVTAGKIELD